jgi:hypothetical protein
MVAAVIIGESLADRLGVGLSDGPPGAELEEAFDLLGLDESELEQMMSELQASYHSGI